MGSGQSSTGAAVSARLFLFTSPPSSPPPAKYNLSTSRRVGAFPVSQEKQLFQLKFTSKQMARLSKKTEKDEAAAKLKVKKSIEKGDTESARIHAQNAIRIKQTGMNYLRLSSRLDAVASRVESAIKMKQVTAQMGAVTKGMDKVLASMDVNQISKVMDQFEASFDNMQVAGDYVEQAMNSATASTMPEEDVDKLMQAVADEHALNFSSGATAAGTGAVAQAQAATGDDDALEKRLAALRG